MTNEEHDTLRIPLTTEMFEELEEIHVGEKVTDHEFVWGLIRELCKDAKMGKLAKTCTVNALEDGNPTQKQIKLKGLELVDVPSDAKWLPENLDAEDVTYFEHKVSNKTMKYLKLYCSFAILRHEEYGNALEADNDRRLEKLKQGKANADMLADAADNFKSAIAKYREATPTIMEEIIYTAVYPKIHKHVADSIDKVLDKENEELYPKEAKTSK